MKHETSTFGGKNKKIIISMILPALGIFLLASPACAQWSVTDLEIFELPAGSIYDIVENFLNWILAIIGFIALIGFAISGIMYFTAAGDETRIATAKSAMRYSIIGVIVALAGLVVVRAAEMMLWGAGLF